MLDLSAFQKAPGLSAFEKERIMSEQLFGVENNLKAPSLLKKAYDGAVIATSYAEILLNQALREFGPQHPVGYPDTAYHLPVVTALSGEKVTRLGELVPILNRMRSQVREKLTFVNARLAWE